MIDPVTLSALLASIATFVVNIFQSFKSGHFKSNCFGSPCVEVDSDLAK